MDSGWSVPCPAADHPLVPGISHREADSTPSPGDGDPIVTMTLQARDPDAGVLLRRAGAQATEAVAGSPGVWSGGTCGVGPPACGGESRCRPSSVDQRRAPTSA